MRRRVRVSRGRIRRHVAETLAHLPVRFREAADNVVIVVETRPRRGDSRESRTHGAPHPHRIAGEPLLGVYRGIPLSERAGYQLVTPDVIAIFRKPLLALCRSRRQVRHQVRLTVLHEFGHFLGLTEERVAHL